MSAPNWRELAIPRWAVEVFLPGGTLTTIVRADCEALAAAEGMAIAELFGHDIAHVANVRIRPLFDDTGPAG